MSSITPTNSVSFSDVTAKPMHTPREAAQQFEALLVTQLLKTARESASLDGQDGSHDAVYEMAEGHFAQVMATRGGLGLGDLIAKQLQKADS